MTVAAGHAYKTGPHRRAIIGGSGEKYSYVGGSSSLFVAFGRSNLAGSQRPWSRGRGSPVVLSHEPFHPVPSPPSSPRSPGRPLQPARI